MRTHATRAQHMIEVFSVYLLCFHLYFSFVVCISFASAHPSSSSSSSSSFFGFSLFLFLPFTIPILSVRFRYLHHGSSYICCCCTIAIACSSAPFSIIPLLCEAIDVFDVTGARNANALHWLRAPHSNSIA